MSDYIRIYSADDKNQATHLQAIGMDYTICGDDTSGDPVVHRKPPVELHGKRRVTCKRCIAIIRAVKNHLDL